MKITIPDVNHYLSAGCGRCRFYNTPACKVNTWREVLVALRNIVLTTPLREQIKWSMPCYTFNNRNVVMLFAFNDFCGLSFFKGALLKDPHRKLEKPGENSQAARYLRFTQVHEVEQCSEIIQQYLHEAIELEKAGARVSFQKALPQLPAELEQVMKEHPGLKEAFNRLTPGRQRGYLIYFTQPKKAATRLLRIEKCIPQILEGKGLYD